MTTQIIQGDVRETLKTLPSEAINCCITSPPYFGLRDYGCNGQIGLEESPEEYVTQLVNIFREVRRALRSDGTLWLNLGDSYTGSASTGGKGKETAYTGERNLPNKLGKGLKQKDLIGIPWMVAFGLRADGWYLRSDIIWNKPNAMPESVTDRPTRSHEYIFLLSKSAHYHYDHEAIREQRATHDTDISGFTGGEYSGVRRRADGTIKADKQRGHSRRHAGFNDRWDHMTLEQQCANGRNKRDVWTVAPAQFREAHFATFPTELIRPCVRAGCPAGGTVLDPFSGAATTGVVCIQENVNYIGLELNPEYVTLSERRLRDTQNPLNLF